MFEDLGMRTDLPRQSLPMLTWQVLSKIPDFVVLAGAFLFGVHWITQRRDEVQQASQESTNDTPNGRQTGGGRAAGNRSCRRGRPS